MVAVGHHKRLRRDVTQMYTKALSKSVQWADEAYRKRPRPGPTGHSNEIKITYITSLIIHDSQETTSRALGHLGPELQPYFA